MANFNDTIVALATPSGVGAIGVVRVSGENAFESINQLLKNKIDFSNTQNSHKLYFRKIYNAQNELLDEVLISVFKGPHSYTGEDTIEIALHGSNFIITELLKIFTEQLQVRLAMPGEFTQRAFLNGKMNLSEAEAVADLIAAESKAAHGMALKQMRGGYSKELSELREQLINLTALIELELDFGEEDVEFADRSELNKLLSNIELKIIQLHDSFSLGNAIKNGVPTVIAGKPNAGKSTLLNALLNEERAIVSSIAGTTRDTVEEVLNINGIKFRLVDTAGLREDSKDEIELIGMQRTLDAIEKSSILCYLFDASLEDYQGIVNHVLTFANPELELILVANKLDIISETQRVNWLNAFDELLQKEINFTLINVSAKLGENIDEFKQLLVSKVNIGAATGNDLVVSNVRHFEALKHALTFLEKAKQSLHLGISGDIVAADLRNVLQAIGSITGEVDYDRDILGTIFSKFCIGK